jgi:membrane-associated protease RseP (regulator of RpoE activity)
MLRNGNVTAKPAVNLEPISDKLRDFDALLAGITSGQKSGSVQIKDISYFKRIRDRIQNYPLLQELYSKEHKMVRTRSTTTFTPMRPFSGSRPGTAMTKISISSQKPEPQPQTSFDDSELFENLQSAQKIYIELAKSLNILRISILNSEITYAIKNKILTEAISILFGSSDNACLIVTAAHPKATLLTSDLESQVTFPQPPKST